VGKWARREVGSTITRDMEGANLGRRVKGTVREKKTTIYTRGESSSNKKTEEKELKVVARTGENSYSYKEEIVPQFLGKKNGRGGSH